MSKTTILFVSANPGARVNGRPLCSYLSLDEEVRGIKERLQATPRRNAFNLIQWEAARPDDLLAQFNTHRPQIVHFGGHGNRAGELILLDRNGRPRNVGKKALVSLFRNFQDCVRVAVLNACHSVRQARAIAQVLDCAIGMKRPIGDRAAITFAAAFYQALGSGCSVRNAFEQGKTALLLEGIPEDSTPELVTRDGVDAGEVVLASCTTVESAVAGETVCELEVTLDRDFDSFTEADEQLFLAAVKALLACPGVRVMRKRRGSVKLTLELTPEQAVRLKFAIRQGKFKEFAAVDAHLLKPAPEEAERQRCGDEPSRAEKGVDEHEDMFVGAEARLQACYEAEGEAAEKDFTDFWFVIRYWVRGLAWVQLSRRPQRDLYERAEEVAQFVCVRIWNSRHYLRERWRPDSGTLRSWLSALVSKAIHTLYRDDLRSRAEPFPQIAVHGMVSAVPAPSGTPADDVALADLFDSFLRELSEPDRTLFEMNSFEALTQGEIAKRLGMSGAYVSRRLSEMEAELRDRLGLHRK